MDGVLLIDKPSGPTSHDVVARMRQVLRVRAVGHTGTLDPLASGLLPLVIGRATRLASLLSGADKTYQATVRLGFATETDDAEGEPVGEVASSLPSDEAIETVLNTFRGTFEQTPPSHSAKRVGGTRAYELARRRSATDLAPVSVTVSDLQCLARHRDTLVIRVRASSGFYVRALARDLGAKLGCGAHIAALRRTASGTFQVDEALPLAEAERLGPAVTPRVIGLSAALPHLSAVRVTALGLRRALHGNALAPVHLDGAQLQIGAGSGPVKILSANGDLIALAQVRAGVLHPTVVLG